MVIFDANMLVALVSERTSADDKARLDQVVKTLSEDGAYVGIPTPAFAEFFVDADQATSPALAALRRKHWIQVLPFDERAAIEAALITRTERATPVGKRGTSKKTWQQIKVDRQILAIAKVNNASAIYTEDDDLRIQASKLGITAFAIKDIPLPPEARQSKLPLEPKPGTARS